MPADPWRPEPLPPVLWVAVELLHVAVPLARPMAAAHARRAAREVLLVHVVADDTEGWAECAAEAEPTYDAEFSAAAALVIRHHLLPRVVAGRPARDEPAASGSPPAGLDAGAAAEAMATVRGHHMARAAVTSAILDAQLRLAGRSLASWLGATRTTVPAGATLGLAASGDELLAEADAAVAAGAARLKVKVAPGRAAAPLRALRAHLAPHVALYADANGSFRLGDPAHRRELAELDEIGLAGIEQPLAPDDLTGHARLAPELTTPVGLDESITSPGVLDTVAALRAARQVCLKPARLGGWDVARRAHDRCAALGLEPWVGGMLETAVGRHGLVAAAALPGMCHPPDLDPRPRLARDLGDPPAVGADGEVAVPQGPGAAPRPDLDGHDVDTVATWRP